MARNNCGVIAGCVAACLAALLAVPVAGAQSARQAPNKANPLVNRVSRAVVTFLDGFSNVECTELVSQTKLKPKGRIEYAAKSSYDYLVLAQDDGGALSLAESRLAKEKSSRRLRQPLMVTNGFSTLLLIFYPEYRDGFEFKQLEDGELDGKTYARLAFRHIRGMRSTAALMVQGHEYPLDMQGTAWIDKSTGEVRKISASLESPMDDIGLHAMHTVVVYAPVRFKETSNIYWLPETATVDVESLHEHWHNTHQFTDYRQFSTSAKEKKDKNP